MRQGRPNATPVALIAFLLACASAEAQQPQEPQQSTTNAQQASPSSTVVYQDWGVRCETAASPRAQKSCEMLQDTKVKGQPATQIIIVRPTKSGPYRVLIQVPHNVWLQAGVRLVSDNKVPGIAAAFKWCVPAGCVAVAEVREDTVKRLRAVTETGKLQFRSFAQKDVVFPVSFKGFGQALEAMSKN